MSVSEELEHLRNLLASARSFQIGRYWVEWRDEGKWAVTDCGSVLSSDGSWEYEPLPSRRSDEFKERTRFPLEEALRLAREKQ